MRLSASALRLCLCVKFLASALRLCFEALLVCLIVRCQLRSSQVLALEVVVGGVGGVGFDGFRGKRELKSYRVEELVTRQHE